MTKSRFADHLILCLGAVVMTGPVLWLVWRLVAGLEAAEVAAVFAGLWRDGVSARGPGPGADTMLVNSLVLALGLAVVKGTSSLLAAYALVFFRLRRATLIYWLFLVTMFFPIESRIMPTFLVAGHLNLLNTYSGMILPIAASGLGLLVFRQYLLQIPAEVLEAARIDGAGPLRALWDIIIPLSGPMIAALFAITFVLGWNQYVWPIMMTTTSLEHGTLVHGMANAGFGGRKGMALAVLALVPPALVVIGLQRWLVRGLTTGIH